MSDKATCTPQQRALEVEREIWKLIDAGKLVLAHGTYGLRGRSEPCHACALGSAAMAVCGVDVGSQDRINASSMRQRLEEKGVMTQMEAIHMEHGFEWGATGGPFHDLGRRLAARKRPAD